MRTKNSWCRISWVPLCTIVCLLVAGESRNAIGASLIHREQTIPILGVTLSESGPIGIVTTLNLIFEERSDQSGLMVTFASGPGKLSPKAQTSVEQAIYRVAAVAQLSTDSWTVRLSVPGKGMVYGDSLSAMVGLTVLACARRETILEDRVITGGIAPDGHISKAGGLSLKIAAASRARIRRVLVPDEFDPSEAEWQTPFLMQVSPVSSISQAYHALTGHEFHHYQ